MRKITAGLFISIDGVVEAPDQWHFPYFNEEMGAAIGDARKIVVSNQQLRPCRGVGYVTYNDVKSDLPQA